MTIAERLLRHDAWTTRELLRLSVGLSDAELDSEFDMGHRTLRRTFLHIVGNMECWCDLMCGKPQRWDGNVIRQESSIVSLLDRVEVVGEELVALGKRVAEEKREEDFFVDTLDDPPRRKPLGAGLVHVATHGIHHRAQCLYMMRRLGVKDLIEGDAMGWERVYLGLEDWPRV